jgi:hypothetical protein
MNYFVPNFGLDEDIASSNKNEKAAQDKYGVATLVQINSDPICGSGGCKKAKHDLGKEPYPMNYKVNDFGVDQDILDSQKHMGDMEAQYPLQ